MNMTSLFRIVSDGSSLDVKSLLDAFRLKGGRSHLEIAKVQVLWIDEHFDASLTHLLHQAIQFGVRYTAALDHFTEKKQEKKKTCQLSLFVVY
jgi:hypothetical protein